jgi:hypothetical protein
MIDADRQINGREFRLMCPRVRSATPCYTKKINQDHCLGRKKTMTEDTSTIEQAQNIRLTAYVKPEALPFLQAHGCIVQSQQGGDLVIFPTGSHQDIHSAQSKRCSTITLPDGTVITAMDCHTRHILLVLNPSIWYTTHLTY